MRKVKFTAITCGILSMVATIAFYLMAFDDLFTEPNGWIPLLLLLAAEVFSIVRVFAAASTAVVHMDKVAHSDDHHCDHDNNNNNHNHNHCHHLSEECYSALSRKEKKMLKKLRKKYKGVINGNPEIELDRSCVSVNVHQHSNTSSYPSDNSISFNKQDSSSNDQNTYTTSNSNSHQISNTSSNTISETSSAAAVNKINKTDSEESAIVVVPAAPVARPRVVNCPCCGANNIISGEIGSCEYCRSPLS